MGFNILEQTKTLGSLGHITYNQGSSSHATALKYVDLGSTQLKTKRQINRISSTIFIKK